MKPQGLDPQRHYRIREVNLAVGTTSRLPGQDTVVDGATLLRDGVTPACTKEFDSAVIEFTAE